MRAHRREMRALRRTQWQSQCSQRRCHGCCSGGVIRKLLALLSGAGTSKRPDDLENKLPPQSSGTIQAIPVRGKKDDTASLGSPPAYESTTDAATAAAFISRADEKATFDATEEEEKTFTY